MIEKPVQQTPKRLMAEHGQKPIWELAAEFNKERKGTVFNAHGNPVRLNEKPESVRYKHRGQRNLNIRRVEVEKYSRVGLL